MAVLTTNQIKAQRQYRVLSDIVQSGPSQNRKVNNWVQDWITDELISYQGIKSSGAYKTFENAVRKLGRELAKTRRAVNNGVVVDSEDYVDLIVDMYTARNNYNSALSRVENALNNSSRRTPAPAPTPAPTAKSNTLSTLLAVGLGVAGTLCFVGGKSGKGANSSQTGYAPPPNPITQNVNANSYQPPQGGYSSRTTAKTSSLLPRLQGAVEQSMEHPNYVTDERTFNAQVRALQQRNTISALDVQGARNQEQIADAMAGTAYSKRRINYEEQNMKVDTTGSWEDTARNVKHTIQEGKETVHEIRGFFRALRGK